MQATTEAVVLLHSIRRTLVWMLAIIPITAGALLVLGDTADPAPCTSLYDCR